MSLKTFHVEIFNKHNKNFDALGITYERFERYCKAVELYALDKTSKLTRCEIVMTNILTLDDDFYEEYAEEGTIILKGLSPDQGILIGGIHDIELAINRFSYHHAFIVSNSAVQAQLEPLTKYLLTYY